MTLDATTSAVVTAVLVVTVGTTYIATSLRYASGGARLWGLAHLLLVVSVLSVVIAHVLETSVWVAVWAPALGNATRVAAVGCLLLGFRAYNGRPIPGPALLVAALSFLSLFATVFEGVIAPGHAGEVLTYLGLAVLASVSGLQAVVGRTGRHEMSQLFAWCLAALALFELGRTVMAIVVGVDSEVFQDWLGTVAGDLVVVVVGSVAAITTFVLRSALDDGLTSGGTGGRGDAILRAPTFLEELRVVLRRASSRTELITVVAVRVEDVRAITASFGQEVAEVTTRRLKEAAREFALPVALVGECVDPTMVMVAASASSPADARRQAGLLYRGIVQRFIDARGLVVPGVGVGVALSQTLGYRAETLVEGAVNAAVEASESDESSVVFATVQSLAVSPFPAESD